MECAFCEKRVPLETDYYGDISLCKMTPLPAIDLMTGEIAKTADPPYWSMEIDCDGMEDFIRINYCPICGKKLPYPAKGEWE